MENETENKTESDGGSNAGSDAGSNANINIDNCKKIVASINNRHRSWLQGKWTWDDTVKLWYLKTDNLFNENTYRPLIETLNENREAYREPTSWFNNFPLEGKKAYLTTFLKRLRCFLAITLLPLWLASGLNIIVLFTHIQVLFITIYHLPALIFVLSLPHAAVVALGIACVFVVALFMIAVFLGAPRLFYWLAKPLLAVTISVVGAIISFVVFLFAVPFKSLYQLYPSFEIPKINKPIKTDSLINTNPDDTIININDNNHKTADSGTDNDNDSDNSNDNEIINTN